MPPKRRKRKNRLGHTRAKQNAIKEKTTKKLKKVNDGESKKGPGFTSLPTEIVSSIFKIALDLEQKREREDWVQKYDKGVGGSFDRHENKPEVYPGYSVSVIFSARATCKLVYDAIVLHNSASVVWHTVDMHLYVLYLGAERQMARVLAVVGKHITRLVLGDEVEVLQLTPGLKELVYKGESPKKILEALSNHCRSLRGFYCYNLEDAAGEEMDGWFVDFFKNCANLEEFVVSGCDESDIYLGLGDSNIGALAEYTTGKLRVIAIESDVDVSEDVWAKLIKASPNLKELIASHCTVGMPFFDVSGKIMDALIEHCEDMITLNFENMIVSDEDKLIRLLDKFKHSLENLNLCLARDKAKISEKTLEFLQNCTKLKELTLRIDCTPKYTPKEKAMRFLNAAEELHRFFGDQVEINQSGTRRQLYRMVYKRDRYRVVNYMSQDNDSDNCLPTFQKELEKTRTWLNKSY